MGNQFPALVAKMFIENPIKCVTYHLHPTFTPSVIKVKQAPFLLSRIGWGYFDVEIEIEFHEKTGLPLKKLTHELSLEGDGKQTFFEIEIPNDNDSLASL